MKSILRPTYQGRSAYLALITFGVIYAAALTLVLAPVQVRSATETGWAVASE